MINIYHDVLPSMLFEELVRSATDPEKPWYYLEDSAYSDCAGGIAEGSFYHMIYLDGEVQSDEYPLYKKIVEIALKNAGVEFSTIYRIRLGFHTYVGSKSVVNAPHIDEARPHKVGLMYINDSDGDTILYNQTYDYEGGLSIYESYLKVPKFTIQAKSSPEANKMVVFDGEIWHSGSPPTQSSVRRTLNINFI